LKQEEPVEVTSLPREEIKNLKGWIKHVTLANTLAVLGALIIAFAFLILGTELLQPKGLIPEENKVAEVLGELMGSIWGQAGFWFMIIAVFVTFTSTMLSDQDGFARMFTDGAMSLFPRIRDHRWLNTSRLRKLFVWILLWLVPILTYLFVGEPVGLLKMAGVVEAAHIPVVAATILYLNRRQLPKELQPSRFVYLANIFAAIFFASFAVIYVFSLTGLLKL
jgi:hypothetical protein